MRRARQGGFSWLVDAKGVAAIEFAFILPLLLVIAFGLIDFGRAIQVQTTLNYAIQAAARCYSVDFGTANPPTTGNCGTLGVRDTALTQAYAATIASGLTAPGSTFTVSVPASGTCAGQVQVTATLLYSLFFGAGVTPVGAAGSGIPTSVTLGSTACYPYTGLTV